MNKDQKIAAALQDLDSGVFSSLRQAAAAYNIAHTTLSRRRYNSQSHVEAQAYKQKLIPELKGILVQ